MKKYVSSAVLMVCLLMTSCAVQSNRAQSGAVMGAAGGAIVGQAIGHNHQATLLGALAGTMIGYMVGNEMDKYDREQLNHVYERGVSGQPNSWVNPDTGSSYSVVPQPAVNTGAGPCRQANITAVIDGRTENTVSKACRDANGQWVLQQLFVIICAFKPLVPAGIRGFFISSIKVFKMNWQDIVSESQTATFGSNMPFWRGQNKKKFIAVKKMANLQQT